MKIFYQLNRLKLLYTVFLQHHAKQWVIDLKDALLKNENCNVIVVDWSGGSQFPYTRATANTQVVGAELGRLLNTLINDYELSADKIHLIGHNLGAHIAGYAGERVKDLGRISGLDPAGPYFENTDSRVRLDEGDAKFVDVIHTDGKQLLKLGIGLMQKSGHVDFYPNGGEDMPKCPSTSSKLINGIFALGSVTSADDGLGCNSLSSVKFFTDSILNKDCKYVAYNCKDIQDFNDGKCLKCSEAGCNHMGYWASKTNELGFLFLNTQAVDKYPYCHFHYLVTLNSKNTAAQTQTRGQINLSLEGSTDNSSTILFDDGSFTMRPGSVESRLVTSNKNLGRDIVGVSLQFTKTTRLLSSWLYQNEWSFDSLFINDGYQYLNTKFCAENDRVKSGESMRFARCD